MKHIKFLLTLFLTTLLGVGQMWAADAASVELCTSWSQTFAYATAYTHDYTIDDLNGGTTTMTLGVQGVYRQANAHTYFQMNKKTGYFKNTTALPGKITKIETTWSVAKGATKCYFANGAEATSSDATVTVSAGTSVTYTPDNAADYYFFNIDVSTGSGSAQMTSCVVYYEKSGSAPSPSVSVTPSSWDFGTVHASAEASKVFSVSGSNLTAGTLSISVPAGFSVSPSSISVTEATLAATNVTVSKNTTAIDDYSGNLSISATCGLTEAKTVALEMSVVADPEPTGTFEPFSGDIEEGDYLIVADGAGMNTTVSGNRLQYTALTLTGENYVNPDESVIWHIAESATAGYWTIYSGAESKYAAATGSNNQAQMLESGTDNKSLWEITHSEAVYTITNKSNSRFLKKNGTYGFGCYADGTVSLYKKQVEGQPKAPTFSIPGGNYETAQSVELSCETEGVTIHYTLDGTTPTNASPAYSTALAISSTTTIKAIAIKNDVSSTVASATYTIVVWQTVADVWNSITVDGPLNAHIYGYVSQTNVSGYANNFYISDNGSTEGNQLYAYRMDMNSFTVAVGDKVKLAGDLTIHNEVKEFKYTNAENCGKVIALEAKGALQSVAVSGTPIKTEYAANEDFDPTGLKVMGTYANGFVGEITEGITWSNDLTGGKVTKSTTVHVTATVSEIASSAYDVAVTVAAKTLVSIALSYDAVEVYQGLELPKPTVTATYSEGDPEDVTAQAVFTGYDASTTGDQEITVTYTFGGHDETANYTVTVNPIFNVELAASVARNLIVNVVGNTESTDDMIVRGKVSYINNASSKVQTYWISDDGTRTNEVEIFKGKYLSGADFTSANQLRVGDEVVVIGKVINYNNSTPEFANGKSEVQSHVRTPNFAITDVTALEVGATDLAVADLTINVEGEGAVTFASSDNTDAVTIVDGKLHAVAAGTATITANLAADGIYKAATATFDVTVVAATVKYAITFDGNGADGGSAPEAIANQPEGVPVTLPANSYTKTGKVFSGWKVINNTTTAEVEVVANAFTMPASAVTIQAQWAEPSVWATTYSSNITLAVDENDTKAYAEKVKITIEEVLTELPALRAATSSAAGTCHVIVPAGTQTLHFHAAAWNAKASTVTVKMGETTLLTQSLISDAGISNTSPYTLSGNAYEYYYSIDLSSYSLTEETRITFSVGSDKRFVLFGVNQEGGVVPVLDHIAISGIMTNTTGWKTGDEIVPEGLTVNAYYTLNEVEQAPVDVTSSVVWSHAALVEDQTEVTLTATFTDEVVKSANVNVTIDAVETGDPTIITNPASYLNFGSSVVKDAVVAPKTITVTLKNITNATATLGGTNFSAFSIDDTEIVDGDVITVSVNTATPDTYAGTVTIKDNDSETQKVINLSMTVVEPEVPETAVSTSSKWVVATEIADGMEVLITGVKSGTTYAVSEQGGNNRTTAAGTLNEEVFTPGANTMSFTLVAQGESTYALRASNGKYLYAASSGSNQLKTRDEIGDDGKAVWTISIGEGNVASIVANCETANWRNTMRFNQNGQNNPVVACYASASQDDIKLYVPKPATPEPELDWTEGVRTGLTEGWYFTICLNKSVTHVRGASIWRVLSKADDSTHPDIVLEEVELPLDAGRPYFICATAASLDVVYSGGAVGAPVNDGDNNGLIGSFTKALISQSPNNYIIYDNELYFVNSAEIFVGANRAYLDMTGVPDKSDAAPIPGHRRVSMKVNGAKVPTGFENIDASDQPMKLMIDGQIYILRGEKIYDTTGRLVK